MIYPINKYDEALNENMLNNNSKIFIDSLIFFRKKYMKDYEKSDNSKILKKLNSIFNTYDIEFIFSKSNNKYKNLYNEVEISSGNYSPIKDEIEIYIYEGYLDKLFSDDYEKLVAYSILLLDEMLVHRTRWSKKGFIRKSAGKIRYKRTKQLFKNIDEIYDPNLKYSDVKGNLEYFEFIAHDSVADMINKGFSKSRIKLELMYPDNDVPSESFYHEFVTNLLVYKSGKSTGRHTKMFKNYYLKDSSKQNSLYKALIKVREDFNNGNTKDIKNLIRFLNSETSSFYNFHLSSSMKSKKNLIRDEGIESVGIDGVKAISLYTENKDKNYYKEKINRFKSSVIPGLDIIKKNTDYTSAVQEIKKQMDQDKLNLKGYDIYINKNILDSFKSSAYDIKDYEKEGRLYLLTKKSDFNKFSSALLNIPLEYEHDYNIEKYDIEFRPEYRYYMKAAKNYMKDYKSGFNIDLKLFLKLIKVGIDRSMYKYIR